MSRRTIIGVGEREPLKKIFNTIDTSGDGLIGMSELYVWFANQGFRLEAAFKVLWAETDTDGDGSINFDEFLEMVGKMRSAAQDIKGKVIPRQFLNPAQYDGYVKIFAKIAGDDGQVDCDELGDFLAAHQIYLAPDRLNAMMKEIDDDNSGYLEEEEFLVLLVKCMGMRKRKVGPGHCSIDKLHEEGWAYSELKQAGYSPKQFVEGNLCGRELLSTFSITEFRKNGISPADLKRVGWDGSDAKSGGYGIKDLMAAQFTVTQVKQAGFDDISSAAMLRRLGVPASAMKQSGWGLSLLKAAGFSGVDLRLGGFSMDGIQGLHRLALKKAGEEIMINGPPGAKPEQMRPSTCGIRSQLDAKMIPSKARTSLNMSEFSMPMTAR